MHTNLCVLIEISNGNRDVKFSECDWLQTKWPKVENPTLKTYQPSYRHCTSKSPFTQLHKNVISIKRSLKNISIIFHMILQKAQAHYIDEVTLALRHNWSFDLSPLAFVSYCYSYYIRAPLHTYDTYDAAQWSRMFFCF